MWGQSEIILSQLFETSPIWKIKHHYHHGKATETLYLAHLKLVWWNRLELATIKSQLAERYYLVVGQIITTSLTTISFYPHSPRPSTMLYFRSISQQLVDERKKVLRNLTIFATMQGTQCLQFCWAVFMEYSGSGGTRKIWLLIGLDRYKHFYFYLLVCSFQWDSASCTFR